MVARSVFGRTTGVLAPANPEDTGITHMVLFEMLVHIYFFKANNGLLESIWCYSNRGDYLIVYNFHTNSK